MKLDMNFQANERYRTRQLRVGLTALAGLAGAALLAALVAGLLVYVPDEPSPEMSSAEAEGQPLSATRLVQIAEQSARMMATVRHQGEAARTVLDAIQRALPVNVKLRSLEYSAEKGRGVIIAESADIAQLNVFVRDLDMQPGIDSAMVARQTSDPNEPGSHVHEVVLVAEAL